MADNRETDDEPTFSITLNCVESGVFLNIPYRRWFEAVISFIVIVFLIKLIPFTDVVSNVLCLTFGGSLFAFNLKGIANRSVTEMIAAEYRFRKNKRILHLRGPEYIKEKQDFSKYAGGDETNAEKWIRKIKEFLNGYADRILEDSSSKKD